MNPERYERVSGGWQFQIGRTKTKGFRHKFTVRVNRPGPCRSHKWYLGPLRFVIAPSVGTIRERIT
jgi:hypothetical protein